MSMTTLVPRGYAERLQDQLDCALQLISIFVCAETDFEAGRLKAEILKPDNWQALQEVLTSRGYPGRLCSNPSWDSLEKVLPDYFAVGDATEALRRVLGSYVKGALPLPESLDEFLQALPPAVKADAAANQRFVAEDPDEAKIVRERYEAAIDWLFDEAQFGPGVGFCIEAYRFCANPKRADKTGGFVA